MQYCLGPIGVISSIQHTCR